MFKPSLKSIWLKIALLAMFATTSIPLGLLQVGVWANMFDNFYEETQSISLSAEWVLDGYHRCLGCELVTDLDSKTKEAVSENRPHSLDTKLLLQTVSSVIIERPYFTGNIFAKQEPPAENSTPIELPPPIA
jgi:hypothetical protein